MSFTWKFSTNFAKEFYCLSEHDADKIIDFTYTYQNSGLSDFKKYEGKIKPSWAGSDIAPETYKYAKSNSLWHYHVGIPEYRQSKHGDYMTSDWLLHFQWPDRGNEIAIVDLYSHYTSNNDFYLPPESYLEWVVSDD